MSDAYIIEVHSTAAGLIVRERGGFRFFSAAAEFAGLDGHLFRNSGAAERAATGYRAKGGHHVER